MNSDNHRQIGNTNVKVKAELVLKVDFDYE